MATDSAPNLRADPDERARAPRRRKGGLGVTLLVAALVAAGGWYWWDRQQPAPAGPPQPPVAAAPQPAPAETVVDTTPKYPLETTEEAQAVAATDVPGALAQLLGQDAVNRFLELGDFPRRVVATVDNLGRAHAPPAIWPVQPTSGRFSVERSAQGEVIAAANAQRYAPFVRLVSGVDAAKAAALYRRMYPLLQQSYRELGFGERYFNDRVVEVIDLLLATPQPSAPPEVRLTEVKGPIAPERPWVRYEFADPRLESLSAGQKMLVRMGPENAAPLKRKLAEFRAQVVAGGAGNPR